MWLRAKDRRALPGRAGRTWEIPLESGASLRNTAPRGGQFDGSEPRSLGFGAARGPIVTKSRRRSALADLAFLVLEVLAAGGAELLDGELLRHRPLVLGRVVVRAAAVSTRHFDDV